MKHEPQPPIATWLGLELSLEQRVLLRRFEKWLIDEGFDAGLLSPTDRHRVWDRHVIDGLSFALGWVGDPPEHLLDAGSGGGLPGIPLAIAFPETAVTLMDRSTKRVGLLKRAIRVLGLANVEAIAGEVGEVRGLEAVTMRAVVGPSDAVRLFGRILRPGGRGVLGLAHRYESDPSWETLGGRIVEVTVLDPPGWLLIMQQRGD